MASVLPPQTSLSEADTTAPDEPPTFSVVVPAYNEAECILEFHDRLAAVMHECGDWEVIHVNDGSRDATWPILTALAAGDPHVALISLSRNFGNEIATSAGLDHAFGEAVILIDADLQDPPELISRTTTVT